MFLAIGATAVTLSGKVGLTPFGYHWAECIHAAPDGGVVSGNRTHLTISHPVTGATTHRARCPRRVGSANAGVRARAGDDANGWQAYTKWQTPAELVTFNGRWTVPGTYPQTDGATIFTFTGVQNIDWVPPQPEPTADFDILQPVLQYGSSYAGDYPHYSMASWYVTLGTDVVFSPLKEVPMPGGTIYGTMQMTKPDGTWVVNTIDELANTTTSLTITRPLLQAQPWAYVTLEEYGANSCLQTPPPSRRTPSRSWQWRRRRAAWCRRGPPAATGRARPSAAPLWRAAPPRRAWGWW